MIKNRKFQQLAVHLAPALSHSVRRFGTHCLIRCVSLNVLGGTWKRIYLPDIGNMRALEISPFHAIALYKSTFIDLLTYLLIGLSPASCLDGCLTWADFVHSAVGCSGWWGTRAWCAWPVTRCGGRGKLRTFSWRCSADWSRRWRITRRNSIARLTILSSRSVRVSRKFITVVRCPVRRSGDGVGHINKVQPRRAQLLLRLTPGLPFRHISGPLSPAVPPGVGAMSTGYGFGHVGEEMASSA